MLWILTRNGHADADIRIYRAICRIMRISASTRIGKYIRMAIYFSPEVHRLPKPFLLPSSWTVVFNVDKILSSHHPGLEEGFEQIFQWLLTHEPSPRDCLAGRGFLSLKGFRQCSSQHGQGVPERRLWKCERVESTNRHVNRLPWTLHKLLHLVPVEFPVG